MIQNIRKALIILVIAGLGGFSGAGIYKLTNKEYRTFEEKQGVHLANFNSLAPEGYVDFTKAAETSIHAVVHVKTLFQQKSQYADPFQEFLFGNRGYHQQLPPAEASGSGVIISDDGYIATNNHVIDNADKVEITLNNKRSYIAKVIGTDPSTDLALLKIDEKNLPFIPYGNSDEIKVGEWVLAVGNPFNLNSTVTAGIVSAKARNINALVDATSNPYAIESYIQTDAAVNKGNSGGALVNTQGQLIGINSAIASGTGFYAGYSFAIPVNIVKKVMNDLLEFGEVQRALMGINIRDLDAKLADEKGIKEIKGVYVGGLSERGAAAEAGIQEGDIITKVGEVAVNASPELQEQLSRFRPGDKVNISYLRDGKERSTSVILRNKNGNTSIVKKESNEIISLLGANFEPLKENEKAQLRINNGVKITKLEPGKLRSAGIREGFIITSIDKKEIKNTNDLISALNNKRGGILIEGLYSNGLRAYYGFGI